MFVKENPDKKNAQLHSDLFKKSGQRQNNALGSFKTMVLEGLLTLLWFCLCESFEKHFDSLPNFY